MASESAIIAPLPPGNYTAIVRGVNTTGVALVEVYDLDLHFTLYTNPNDSLLLQGELPSGELIQWYGQRDSDGLPTAINQVILHGSNGDARYEFDEQGRTARAVATNGVVFRLSWISETRALVTAIAPDGSQVDAVFDLQQSGVTGAQHARQAVTPATSTVPFVINVSKCGGRPVNGATVQLQLSEWPPNPLFGMRILRPAVPTGDGTYSGSVPVFDPNAEARDFETQCQRLTELLENILCFDGAFEALCPAIGAAVAAVPGGLPEGLLILAACPELEDDVRVICTTIEAAEGRIGDVICSGATTVVRNFLQANSQYQLRPIVSDVPGLNGSVEGNSQIITGGTIGPLAPFTVDLGNSVGCTHTMHAVLTWSSLGDVDLHVRDSLGRETWYANRTGIPNSYLDVDNTTGFGPENFYLNPSQPGVSYDVFVHYYSDHGYGPTVATVQVFIDDREVTDISFSISDNQMVDVGTYMPDATGSTPEQFSLSSSLLNMELQPVPKNH